jgi:surface protein
LFLIQGCSLQNDFQKAQIRFESSSEEIHNKSFLVSLNYDYACLTYIGGDGLQRTGWVEIKKSNISLSAEFQIPNLLGGYDYQFKLIGIDVDITGESPLSDPCPKVRPSESGWARLGFLRTRVGVKAQSLDLEIPFAFNEGPELGEDFVPGQPTLFSVTPGNQLAVISWTAPPGAGITDYVIQHSATDGQGWVPVFHSPNNSTTQTVTGLLNGRSYVFRVAAVNAMGQGPWSDNSIPIIPNATAPLPFVTQWKTDNTTRGSSASNQITLPLESDGTYHFTIQWGDGKSNNITTWNDANISHTYATAGTYTVTITGIISGFRFSNAGDVKKLINISSFGPIKLGNHGEYFYGASNLTITATDPLDLTGTTDLHAAFSGCSSLTTAPSMTSWQMGNVTNMREMFYKASAFNQPIGNWNTSNVLDMSAMFLGTSAFNQAIGSWNTANVTNMGDMFYKAAAFNQPIGNWDTSKVRNMSGMFGTGNPITTSFNQAIGSWNTASVTDMSFMFYQSTAFNQPIDTWNVAQVTNMENILASTSFSVPNYDNLLLSWSQQNVQTGVKFGSIGVNHSNTSTINGAYDTLTKVKGWIINEPVPSVESCGPSIHWKSLEAKAQ